MQWTPDRNAGFSRAHPHQLYLPTNIDAEYHYEFVNVESQQRNKSSLYWTVRRMIDLRQRSTAFARGSIEFLQPANASVLAYVGQYKTEVVIVVANLSRFAQVAELDLSAFDGCVPEEPFGQARFPKIKPSLTTFTLGPHGFYWLALRSADGR